MIDTIMKLSRSTLGAQAQTDGAVTVTYYEADGRIRQTMTMGDAAAPRLVLAGCRAIESISDLATDWVDVTQSPPTVQPRPVLTGFDKTAIAADCVEEARLAELPIPCRVRIDGAEHIITTGELVLSAAYPGSYRVEIDQFPHMPFMETVTCV